MAGIPPPHSPSIKSVPDSASVLDISAPPAGTHPLPPPIVVANPYKLEGQRLGAVLLMKWISKCADIKYHPKPCDHVQVLRHFPDSTVEVKNLRTGVISTVQWAVFRPVLWHGKCECTVPGTCSCVYEPYNEFQTRQPRENGRKSWHHPKVFSDERQVVGAILVVEQKPAIIVPEPKLGIAVSDRVKILEFRKDNTLILKGRNLRTGADGFMAWKAFTKVGEREICGCENQVCDCLYRDFEASMKHQRTIERLMDSESKEGEIKPLDH